MCIDAALRDRVAALEARVDGFAAERLKWMQLLDRYRGEIDDTSKVEAAAWQAPKDGDVVPCNEKDIPALAAGYARIAELERKLDAAGGTIMRQVRRIEDLLYRVEQSQKRIAALTDYVRECANIRDLYVPSDKQLFASQFPCVDRLLSRAAALLGDGETVSNEPADSALREACRELVAAWCGPGDYVDRCIPIMIRIRTILEGGK